MKPLCFTALFAMIFCWFFVSCKKDEANFEPECNGPAKSYSGNVKAVIQSQCVGCHAQYANHAAVKSAAASIHSSIVNGSMPKGRTMSESEKNTVICWIDAGAPNN